MTIEIHRPELEALIRERMRDGQSVEDVIMRALQWSPVQGEEAQAPHPQAGRRSLAQLFAESPFKGLDIDFERDDDGGRDIIL